MSIEATHDRVLTPTAPAGAVIHPVWVRVTHWINVVAMVVMIGSGWEIYNASPLFPFVFPRGITLGLGLARAFGVKPGDDLTLLTTTKGGSINALAVKVRGVWDYITPTSCRWRQAVSRDGGEAWKIGFDPVNARDQGGHRVRALAVGNRVASGAGRRIHNGNRGPGEHRSCLVDHTSSNRG